MLNLQVESATYLMVITVLCMILTQVWKKVVVPKLNASASTSPWISMVVGVVAAVLAGLVEGNTVMTVLGGVFSGGMASYAFDLTKSVGKLLGLLGVTEKK